MLSAAVFLVCSGASVSAASVSLNKSQVTGALEKVLRLLEELERNLLQAGHKERWVGGPVGLFLTFLLSFQYGNVDSSINHVESP